MKKLSLYAFIVLSLPVMESQAMFGPFRQRIAQTFASCMRGFNQKQPQEMNSVQQPNDARIFQSRFSKLLLGAGLLSAGYGAQTCLAQSQSEPWQHPFYRFWSTPSECVLKDFPFSKTELGEGVYDWIHQVGINSVKTRARSLDPYTLENNDYEICSKDNGNVVVKSKIRKEHEYCSITTQKSLEERQHDLPAKAAGLVKDKYTECSYLANIYFDQDLNKAKYNFQASCKSEFPEVLLRESIRARLNNISSGKKLDDPLSESETARDAKD